MRATLVAVAGMLLLILVCVLLGASPQDWLLVSRVPTTFFGIVGAMTLVALGVGLNYPYSLLILGAMGLIALSKLGRERWRVWLAIGIIYVMPSIVLYNQHEYYNLVPYGQEESANEIAGAISTCAALLAAVGFYYVKKIRPKIMS